MEADIVITWGFAPVPKAAQSAFKRPTKFIALQTPPGRAYGAQVAAMSPSPIRYAINNYAPGTTPLRVACLGFSESCHGVRNLLNSSDGANFDSVVAIDGVHTAYGPNKGVDPNTMKPWLDFAKYAVVNERLLAITHSSIKPPSYASTTQTADWLWQKVTGSDQSFSIPPFELSVPSGSVHVGSPPAAKPYAVSYPANGSPKAARRADGLVILGYNNVDIPAGYADHIWQAHYVLPAVVVQLLAKRWNDIDPNDSSRWS